MTMFKLVLRARKAGSIGVFGERREYEIQAADRDDASRIAIERASNEGLEHSVIVRWTPLP
jgi:hypothetical protein